MTTTAAQPTTTRFRYIDQDDIIYVGEAEISTDKDAIGNPFSEVTILACWRYGSTIEEVFPYDRATHFLLRHDLENAALECRMTPPAATVELPTDWDELQILDTETTYTVEVKAILPEVKTDNEAAVYGLRAVSRVRSMNAGKQYRITAKGGFDEIRRELHRIRLF